MSTDTITNFIESINTVIAWAVTQLTNDGYWDTVYRLDNYDWNEVYKILAYAQIPTCVVVYKGGNYQNQPRAKRRFSVFVAEREWGDKEKVQETMSTVVAKVIGILDHEVAANQALVRVVSDNFIQLKWSGVTTYELGFEVEDY